MQKMAPPPHAIICVHLRDLLASWKGAKNPKSEIRNPKFFRTYRWHPGHQAVVRPPTTSERRVVSHLRHGFPWRP